MTRPPMMELADYVTELVAPHTHREHYSAKIGHTTFGRDHIVKAPALLHQLGLASPSGQGQERAAGGYESRPAASLDSIDTLTMIDLEAARWLRDLGEDDPPNTAACIRRLNGLAASLEPCRKRHRGCCTFHELEHDVRRWWAQARVVTGWDSPAWRPDNTCPMCGVHGSLRVRLADQVALCVDCRETWDQATIGLLAEHIRAESAGVRRLPIIESCWCSWPRPRYDAWPALCPVCASPWCHRAGAAEAGDTPEHAWVS